MQMQRQNLTLTKLRGLLGLLKGLNLSAAIVAGAANINTTGASHGHHHYGHRHRRQARSHVPGAYRVPTPHPAPI